MLKQAQTLTENRSGLARAKGGCGNWLGSLDLCSLFRVLGRVVEIVTVGARIGHLVFQGLDEPVEAHGDQRTDSGSNPVDPVLGIEATGDDTRTKATCRVERTSSELDSDHLSDEKSQTNTDGSNESGSVLLLGKHKDSKDQFSSKKSLDEDTLDQRCTATKSGSNVECFREEVAYNNRGKHRPENLSEEQNNGSCDADGLDHQHGHGDSRVEQATTDTEEDPDVDHERETEDDRDVEEFGNVETTGRFTSGGPVGGVGLDVGDLCTSKGKEKEHSGANKLSYTSNEVVLEIRVHPLCQWKTHDLGLLLSAQLVPLKLACGDVEAVESGSASESMSRQPDRSRNLHAHVCDDEQILLSRSSIALLALHHPERSERPWV
ncbi:hypothetical protein HG531_011011 [Fusarium graminearum]|nr:hypothetical protein HG531_011011 [Fusarium graminearum]